MSELRVLHLVGATGTARTEWLGDREYLVVPTVALVGDNVIHAVNSPEAEFVPASILSADGWERQPLMLGHPTRDGVQISAHDPKVLEASSFGFVSAPVVKNKRLGMESWCDVKKLEALGQQAMLADLRAGKPIEVSTGSFVHTRQRFGVHQGKRYAAEWLTMGPDHMAFLPKGVGACSIEMGCGAHRAAMQVEAMEQTIIDPDTLRCLRDIPQSVRDEMKDSDFAGPNESFPIKTQADVDAASHLVGHASNPSAVKARIIAIAKRKGLSIPDAWKMKTAAALPDKAQVGGSMKVGDKVKINKPGHEAHGKTGTITDSAKGGTVHTVGDHGTFHASNLKAASLSLSALRSRVLALFDTPEQAASEEAAELVAYKTLFTFFDQIDTLTEQARGIVDDLISDEEDDPTETPSEEDAEEEVETARLQSVQMLAMSISSAASSAISVCLGQLMPEATDVTPSDPRYMEMLRTAIGKEISAKNKKVIQAAHDSSHDVHSQTVALGAECAGMKAMAGKMKDCPTCDGTGQVKADGKQQDCPTCGGEGQVRAAENGTPCGCQEVTVEKKERIAALTAAGVKDVTEKTSDEVLTVLEAKVESDKKHAAELKAAQDKQTETEAKLKAAEANQISPEELATLRALDAKQKQQDAADKAALVAKLEPLKTLSKADLEGKTLEELRTLARFAKVDVDYSVIGVPVPRNAEVADEFKAPNPYEPGLKALREHQAAR